MAKDLYSGQYSKWTNISKLHCNWIIIFFKKIIFQETVADLVGKICQKFNILPAFSERLWLYERELSVRQQEIFYRKLEKNENPLLLSLIWIANQVRCNRQQLIWPPWNRAKVALKWFCIKLAILSGVVCDFGTDGRWPKYLRF